MIAIVGVFDGRRVLFLNPVDMEARNLRAGQIVDIYSHFEGEVRKAPRFAIVPYAIARRSAAAYYPETNVLIPIRSVAAKSNQPAAKCIRITLTPVEPYRGAALFQGGSRSQHGSSRAPCSLMLGQRPHMLSLRPCVCGLVQAFFSLLCFSPWSLCARGFFASR